MITPFRSIFCACRGTRHVGAPCSWVQLHPTAQVTGGMGLLQNECCTVCSDGMGMYMWQIDASRGWEQDLTTHVDCYVCDTQLLIPRYQGLGLLFASFQNQACQARQCTTVRECEVGNIQLINCWQCIHHCISQCWPGKDPQ